MKKLTREISRRNEASAFVSSVLMENILKSKGYEVERISDERYHKIREKDIRALLEGRKDCELLIKKLFDLRERKKRLQDFICRNKRSETVFFVENKEWYGKEKKIDQKEAIEEFQDLGYTTFISGPKIYNNDGTNMRDQLNEEQVKELLKLKIEDTIENEEKDELYLEPKLFLENKGKKSFLFKIKDIK